MRKKIVDCIIFDGDLGMLNFRIAETLNDVDLIYVFYHGENKKTEIYSEGFLHQKEKKINILESPKKIQDGFSEIRKLLPHEQLNFDDIISISKQNELPDFKKFDGVIDELSFSPLCLYQKKYTWTLDFCEDVLHEGSKVFLYTNFLKNRNYNIEGPEKMLRENKYESYVNGFSFFGFETDNSIFKSNLLPFENINKFETNLLSNTSDNVRFNHIYNYVEKKEIKLRDKKIFYIGDVESNIFFDERMIFYKTNILSSESDFNIIYVPNFELYDSENFELEYFLNEVKKYMSILFPLPHDEIIVNFDFMNEIKKVLWRDFERNNLLELLVK